MGAQDETIAGKDQFRNKLCELLNYFSMENESSTPDFILAKYLSDCLDAFDRATLARSAWYHTEHNEKVAKEETLRVEAYSEPAPPPDHPFPEAKENRGFALGESYPNTAKDC